jgi:8-oxo-dGTP pyrophosphatase MutT (NUDIX family)
VHKVQLDILKKLLFSDTLRYAQIKPKDMEGSQFTFHLDQLTSLNFIRKSSTGEYSLTESGKGHANQIDFDSPLPNKQAKHSVVFCCTRKNATEVLVYTRLKNPYYGHFGFPTGKVQYGEKIIDAAIRELKEETNLIGKPYLTGIRHYRVYFPTADKLVEDKVMYFYRIDDPQGDLRSNPEGEFYWHKVLSLSEIRLSSLPEFTEQLDLIINFNGTISFQETEQYPKNF